jgi:hypothetical protein
MYGCHPDVAWQALVMALVERYWAMISIFIFDSRRRSKCDPPGHGAKMIARHVKSFDISAQRAALRFDCVCSFSLTPPPGGVPIPPSPHYRTQVT